MVDQQWNNDGTTMKERWNNNGTTMTLVAQQGPPSFEPQSATFNMSNYVQHVQHLPHIHLLLPFLPTLSFTCRTCDRPMGTLKRNPFHKGHNQTLCLHCLFWLIHLTLFTRRYQKCMLDTKPLFRARGKLQSNVGSINRVYQLWNCLKLLPTEIHCIISRNATLCFYVGNKHVQRCVTSDNVFHNNIFLSTLFKVTRYVEMSNGGGVASPSSPYLAKPNRQCLHPMPNVPAPHAPHFALPTSEDQPIGQAMQLLFLPFPWKYGVCGHTVQRIAPAASLNSLGLHSTHNVCPDDDWDFPVWAL